MADNKLVDVIAQERNNLENRQTALVQQRADIDNELAAIESELTAVSAYEKARGGRVAAPAAAPAPAPAKVDGRRTKKKAAAKKKPGRKPGRKPGPKPAAPAAAAAAGPKTRRPRRGSRRDVIVAALDAAPDGLSRGDILDAMKVKGDKAAEQAVSNALTAMKKAGRIKSKDGKYHA